MTTEEHIAQLEAENAVFAGLIAQLKAEKTPKLGLKVSKKGALSLYGIGRFPVTLYPEQWTKVLDKDSEIRGFIKTNWDKFSHKTPAADQPTT